MKDFSRFDLDHLEHPGIDYTQASTFSEVAAALKQLEEALFPKRGRAKKS